MKKVTSFLLVMTMILCAGTFTVSASTAAIGGEKINRVVYVDSLDIFVVCGSDGIYTSTANSDWTKRSPYTDEALNFGYSEKQDVGIIVKSISESSQAKTPVLINDLSEEIAVHHATEVQNGVCNSVMFFAGGFCYDPYSECFWAVGREYSLEYGYPEFTRLGIYYTDGKIETANYLGTNEYIMKWTRQTGDVYEQYERYYVNAPAGTYSKTYTHQSNYKYAYTEMKASGSGHIIAYNMTQAYSGNAYPIEGRRGFTVIEIEKDGDSFTSNGYVTTNGGGDQGYVCATMGLGSDGMLYSYSNASSTRNRIFRKSISSLIDDIKEKGVDMQAGNYFKINTWSYSTMSSYSDISVTVSNLAYSDFCVLGNKCIILSKSNASTPDLIEFTPGGSPAFQKASFCSTNDILGTTYSAGTYSSIATDNKGNLCIAVKGDGQLKASIIDTEEGTAVTSSLASTKYTHITYADEEIYITPGSAEAHGLLLGGLEEDEMGYTYEDPDGAKYACDLDGIDVNGIYAWEDALSGTYTFELTAYSIDFPSIRRTVQITVEIEED